MKKAYCMILMVSLLVAPYVYAQMGGGSRGGGSGGMSGRGMMGGQETQKHMEGMMQGHEVTGNMMHHMGQMSRMMQQLREMMAVKSDAESRKKMSDLMQDMSEHMMDMSSMLKKDSVSQKDMQELDQQNLMMQKKYDMMRW
jgi:hypothetical protein